MDEMKLRPYDGIAIAGFLILPGLLYTGPGYMAEQSGSAAWMALLAAHVVMLCIFLITTSLMRRYGGKDIIQTASMIVGRPIGLLFGIALCLYFIFTAGVLVREAAEVIKIYALHMTPVFVVAGLIMLTAMIMNFFGGRAIIKSAGFFFILILLGIAYVALLGLNRYNPDYLFPILGNGAPEIAKSSWHIASMIDGVIILALFAPSFADTNAMRKSGTIAMLITGVSSVLLYLCFIMMFSTPIASNVVSGFIEMGKSSYYNHFFYRFESVLLFFLIFSAAVTASLGLFIARKSAAITFQARPSKWITVICAVAAAIVAILPKSLQDLTNQYLALVRQYGIFFLAGFPLLLFIISSIKRLMKYEKN